MSLDCLAPRPMDDEDHEGPAPRQGRPVDQKRFCDSESRWRRAALGPDHRSGRSDDHSAARAGARSLTVDQHCAGGDVAADDHPVAPLAGHGLVSVPAAHRHPLPTGPERQLDPPDPHDRLGWRRHRGVRFFRRRRFDRGRVGRLPDTCHHPVRGDHERRLPGGRSWRPLHPRRHARQADGDRRRPGRRAHRRGVGQASAPGDQPGSGLLRRDGRRLQVRQGRRDRRGSDHRDQPAGRHDHRRCRAGDGLSPKRSTTSRPSPWATGSCRRSRRYSSRSQAASSSPGLPAIPTSAPTSQPRSVPSTRRSATEAWPSSVLAWRPVYRLCPSLPWAGR